MEQYLIKKMGSRRSLFPFHEFPEFCYELHDVSALHFPGIELPVQEFLRSVEERVSPRVVRVPVNPLHDFPVVVFRQALGVA